MSRHRFGLGPNSSFWPVCKLLPIAASTYYAHAAVETNPALASKRTKRDQELCTEIARIHAENFSVYGARKIWHQLKLEGITNARCTVERLMRFLALRGVRRGKAVTTTVRDRAQRRKFGYDCAVADPCVAPL